MRMAFEWDPNKAKLNLRRHGISFTEAATVFDDPLSDTSPDPDHSTDEDRFIIIGMSDRSRLLMVSHADRGDHIRIISARDLTRSEREDYEQDRSGRIG